MEGYNASIYMHRNSNNHDEWIPDANFNVCSRAPLDSTQMLSFAVVTGVLEAHLHAELLS